MIELAFDNKIISKFVAAISKVTTKSIENDPDLIKEFENWLNLIKKWSITSK